MSEQKIALIRGANKGLGFEGQKDQKDFTCFLICVYQRSSAVNFFQFWRI